MEFKNPFTMTQIGKTCLVRLLPTTDMFLPMARCHKNIIVGMGLSGPSAIKDSEFTYYKSKKIKNRFFQILMLTYAFWDTLRTYPCDHAIWLWITWLGGTGPILTPCSWQRNLSGLEMHARSLVLMLAKHLKKKTLVRYMGSLVCPAK